MVDTLTYETRAPRPKTWSYPSPVPKADTSKLGYVRWSRWLAEAEIPASWEALDFKLLVLCCHKMSLNNPWGANRISLREVQEFLGPGATKPKIAASLYRLAHHPITVKEPLDLFERR
jgi:hypothetical protein